MSAAFQPASTRPWALWVSLAVLPGQLMLQSPFYELLSNRGYAGLMLVVGPITLLGCAALWFHGVRDAGRGLRRGIFLAAFAGSLTMVGMSISQAARGFYEGWTCALDHAALELATGGAQTVPSWSGLVDWLFLTILLGVILHFLEKHRGEAERQRALAAEAQDAVLRAKLAPHFIFNCLNTLKAQLETDPAAAAATTDRLASLFRQVVAVSGLRSHPLRAELEFVETYLGLEKARLGERLQVVIEIPEALEGCELPPLALQVLVENAVQHGVAPLEAGGQVRIGARREGDLLTVWVEDPGQGLSGLPGTGTALATLRQRLARPEDLVLERVAGHHRVTFRWRLA